jgi:hypothetical protein
VQPARRAGNPANLVVPNVRVRTEAPKFHPTFWVFIICEGKALFSINMYSAGLIILGYIFRDSHRRHVRNL